MSFPITNKTKSYGSWLSFTDDHDLPSVGFVLRHMLDSLPEDMKRLPASNIKQISFVTKGVHQSYGDPLASRGFVAWKIWYED